MMKRVFSASSRMYSWQNQDMTPAPIFIVGMPRSGTSLTEQILASHSAVYGAGELDALDAAIRCAVEHFPADLTTLDSAAWKSIRERYLTELSCHAGGAAYVSDKMPSNFLHIGAIGILFPDAKIIHCRRDPLDIGLSCFRNHFVSDQLIFTCNLTDLGRYYRHYIDLMTYWKKTRAENIYDIQYESLVTNPEREVRALLEFCELPFEDNCLSFHNSKRTVKTASAAQVRQPIYRDSLQGWRHYEHELRPLLSSLKGHSGRLMTFFYDTVRRFSHSSKR